MFAAALNSGGNASGRAALLAKLQKKKQEKSVEIERLESEKDDGEDVEMEASSASESSGSDSSSDESEDSSEEEMEEKDEELNLLKRKREEEEVKEKAQEEKEIDRDEETSGRKEGEQQMEVGHHSSILSRFKQTMSLQPQLELAGETVDSIGPDPLAGVKVNEVRPLPQPALPRDQKLYSQQIKNRNLDWLTKPAYYQTDLTRPFGELGIDEAVLGNIQREYGYENAFAVQVTLIEELLVDIRRQTLDPTPRGDYLVNAATGSGKTIAYLVPVLQAILTRRRVRGTGVKAVVMVPTRPLVSQVYGDALRLSKGTDVTVVALRGDMSVGEERERLREADVVVTTPGRLMEHIDHMDLGALRFLIVDEADKLLNQSYQNWCDVLVERIDGARVGDLDARFTNKCVKVVLSATLTTSSEKLSHLGLFRPKVVVVNDGEGLVNELYQLPAGLEEHLVRVNDSVSFYKPLLLLKVLMTDGWRDHGLVFAKSNETAIRLGRLLQGLARTLNAPVDVAYISSTMKPAERQRVLRDFDSRGGVVIATDLLSRGINLNSIRFVVNYDLPLSTKEYVHRVGRTARGGNVGKALSLAVGDEYKWFKRLAYSGGAINRNGKHVVDMDTPLMGPAEREIYEEALGALQKEVAA